MVIICSWIMNCAHAILCFFRDGMAAIGYYKRILAPTRISCVALGKSPNLSELHILHLQSGDINTSIVIIVCIWHRSWLRTASW